MSIVVVVRLLVLLLLIALTVILITRRLDVPYTLGLVVVGLGISLFVNTGPFHLTPDLVLFVFLPALLFEGSWSMSVRALRDNWLTIFLLAVPGLLLEAILIAVPLRFLTPLSWIDAFLLAAILSPTDPIAVLGLFRQLKVDAQLSTIIEGESLFNDGVAGVLYQVVLVFVLASIHHVQLTPFQMIGQGLLTLLQQAGGGIVVGILCGFLISRFVKYIDDPLIEITITIVTAYGVYLLADYLHMSGILAVIVAGLILGSYGQMHAMSERTREVVDSFWSVIAFVANALLFLLVGVQLDPLEFLQSAQLSLYLSIAGLAIAAVLVARYLLVLILPAHLPGMRLRSWRFLIFWSGLRGALSLALVLALPLELPSRAALLFATYAVVFFTLMVQGFSLRFILHRIPSLHN
ncbi:cation:proton antiporter [Tengunoibacter tsumagoiensis]|uniref:Cation/H+ exchanger transmembrane domain-containing protein n=1 Tax=Tengunoibacter tsumagoiensis TaxID=2014871 RepID=A0A401ZTI4_9CHLR|nr:sodium:proton antiporter [Tengunoibacter tsumagoiensis]GCE10177.1 hypothetical protein KTT_00360 [Tengunoibacter tsumagoiensis]